MPVYWHFSATNLGIQYPHGYPHIFSSTADYMRHKKVAGLCTPGHQLLFRSADRFFSAVQSQLEPVQYFTLNPSHSIGAELYPYREFPGRLQPRDVLRRVENQLLELAL